MSKVIVHHEPHPEDNAALQAWYSRSNKSVVEHREKLAKEGSGKFMDQIFIQYGHASVGDLGTTTVYFEGVSMIAAKALQDNPLYNGQECSSRYIDMGSVEMVAPESKSGKDAVEKLRQFYVHSLPEVVDYLKSQHPLEDDQREAVYNKAINARAFDILRGFLPCGTTTNVAWSGTLRNFKENLERLRHHPLTEVANLASDAYKQLYDAYPNSFHEGIASAFMYEDLVAEIGTEKAAFLGRVDQFYYTSGEVYITDIDLAYGDMGRIGTADKENAFVSIDPVSVASGMDLLGSTAHWASLDLEGHILTVGCTSRPRGLMIPRHSVGANEPLSVLGTLDFGSFRDLQRHRGGYIALPIVTGDNGFHKWYIDNLPPGLREHAKELVYDVLQAYYGNLDEPDALGNVVEAKIRLQYMLPMGMQVDVEMEFPLRQLVYFVELRSGQTVHPTLREFSHGVAKALVKEGLEVHYDSRPDIWSVRRGNQDIIVK